MTIFGDRRHLNFLSCQKIRQKLDTKTVINLHFLSGQKICPSIPN